MINLLGNDGDPSTPVGIGNTNDIRLVNWPAELYCGSQAQPDAVPSLANFDSLAKDPCTYTPPPDADAPGFNDTPVFNYTIVQRSNLKEATSKVTIQVLPNEPPSAGAADIDMMQNTSYGEARGV